MMKARDGFKTWAAAAAPEFTHIGAGWDAAIDISVDVASMEAFAAKVVDELLRSWTTQLQGHCASIMQLCIPQGTLHASRMMVETPLQLALTTAVKGLHGSNLLTRRGAACSAEAL